MKHQTVVPALLTQVILILCTTVSQAASDRRPNIVFLFADDLGYGDLDCYGHPDARTPALDQLAKEGTRFTQYYVTGLTCDPSRTGLMTGLFPARFPKYAADFGFRDRVTITELLKKRGYKTGHFGKWHIGPDDSDGIYGIDTVRTIVKRRDKSAGRDDDLYSAAIDFIRENKDGPFYVNVWGHATHFPVNTPDNLVAESKDLKIDREHYSATMQHKFDECLQIGGDLDESMRQYLGDVYQIDLNVGRMLKTIDGREIRCIWLAHSKDAENWVQLKMPLVEPIEGEMNDCYGPAFLRWKNRNFIVYQDHTAWRGGNIKYVEVDQEFNPVGDKGERYVLMDPPSDPPLKDRYRGCEFYLEGNTLYLYSSASRVPRIIVYATADVKDASPRRNPGNTKEGESVEG